MSSDQGRQGGAGIGNIDDTIWHWDMATHIIGAYRIAGAFLPAPQP